MRFPAVSMHAQSRHGRQLLCAECPGIDATQKQQGRKIVSDGDRNNRAFHQPPEYGQQGQAPVDGLEYDVKGHCQHDPSGKDKQVASNHEPKELPGRSDISGGLHGIAGHDHAPAHIELHKVRGSHGEQVQEPGDFGGGTLRLVDLGDCHSVQEYKYISVRASGNLDEARPQSGHCLSLRAVFAP
jgi:hypothetical protein